MINNIFSFSATETGYNHIKKEIVCEDASDFYDDEKMHICVVADGHGSNNYPRTNRGARFAVDAAIKCTIEFINNADPDDVLSEEKYNFKMLNELAKSILGEWYAAVNADCAHNPFAENELGSVSEKYRLLYLSEDDSIRKIEKAYGCTLILYAITEQYSFGLQIGDGRCVVIDQNGDFTEPIPWDDNCQLNVTTSICDSDAIDEFRFSVSNNTPIAVFCGSDGIDDSYSNSEELYALYRSILKIFIDYDEDTGKNEIKEYLPTLTKRGSGDDVSIGLIMNYDRAKYYGPKFDIQSEIFKLKEKLAELYSKRDITTEKDNSLSLKVKKWLDSGKSEDRMEDINKINELRLSNEKTLSEIKQYEEKIQNLSESLQNLDFVSENLSKNDDIDKKEEIIPENINNTIDNNEPDDKVSNQVNNNNENKIETEVTSGCEES